MFKCIFLLKLEMKTNKEFIYKLSDLINYNKKYLQLIDDDFILLIIDKLENEESEYSLYTNLNYLFPQVDISEKLYLLNDIPIFDNIDKYINSINRSIEFIKNNNITIENEKIEFEEFKIEISNENINILKNNKVIDILNIIKSYPKLTFREKYNLISGRIEILKNFSFDNDKPKINVKNLNSILDKIYTSLNEYEIKTNLKNKLNHYISKFNKYENIDLRDYIILKYNLEFEKEPLKNHIILSKKYNLIIELYKQIKNSLNYRKLENIDYIRQEDKTLLNQIIKKLDGSLIESIKFIDENFNECVIFEDEYNLKNKDIIEKLETLEFIFKAEY